MADKLIYIITARGGSRRIKNKNIKSFAGKPLIYWTIKQALRVSEDNKIILSTDDEEIMKVSKSFKKVMIVKRPKSLATPKASSIDTVRHVIKKLSFDGFFILLQPTSPLRLDSDINLAKNINSNIQFQK